MEEAVAKKRTLLDIVQHIGSLEDSAEMVPAELEAEFKAEVAAVIRERGDTLDNYARLMLYHAQRAAGGKGELVAFKENELERLKRREKRSERELERLSDA